MKKYRFIIFSLIMLFLSSSQIQAASFNMSSSTNQTSPNGTFTIQVGGDCIGRVDLSISNGSLSTNSIWVEQGYTSVSVTAGSSGSVVITATPTAGFSDSDANIYNPGSRNITVNIVTNTSTPPPTWSNTYVPVIEKSSDNNLSSLTVSEGEFSPSFHPEQSEYSLNLSKDTTSFTVSANPSDSKATIEGIGEISVKPGNNVVEIVVTAEDGSKKTYTIKAYVDDTPQVYLDYENKKIGIVRNYEGITIPEGFSQLEYTINEKKVLLFTKEQLTVLYGMDEENKKEFYLFNKEKNEIIYKFIPITIKGQNIYLIDKKSNQSGTKLEEITISDHIINCYQFQDNQQYCLLTAIHNDGKIVEYLYEKSENTIQLFPRFLTKCNHKIKTNSTLSYILSSIIVILMGGIIFFVIKWKKGCLNEKNK